MKGKTVFKIAFCVLLAAALAWGAVDLHWGRNHLNATFAEIRNGSFEYQSRTDIEEYYPQRLKITVVNENDFDVTVVGLRVEKGDESRFLLYRTPEKAVTVPAHTTEPQSVWFRVVSFGPENEQVLDSLRDNFSVRLIYADASTGITAMDGADAELLQTEWIR